MVYSAGLAFDQVLFLMSSGSAGYVVLDLDEIEEFNRGEQFLCSLVKRVLNLRWLQRLFWCSGEALKSHRATQPIRDRIARLSPA